MEGKTYVYIGRKRKEGHGLGTGIELYVTVVYLSDEENISS